MSYQQEHVTALQKVTILNFNYAQEVSTGDEVLVKENNDILPAKVIKISSLMMQGDIFSF